MSPATPINHFSPIFPVKDLRRALAHYQALGFVTKAYNDGDEYGFADRDGIGLHFAAEPDHQPGTGSSATYLYVEDADELYAEWSRPGIGGITRPVGSMDYQLREGSHIDPDGNLIRFGSEPRRRSGVEHLRAHLESRYGIEVERISQLDLGVFRVDRRDGPNWVARQFPALRPVEAAIGDGEVLRFLAEHDFPAERGATAEPVSVLDGQGVLVTEHIEPVPRQERRVAIRDLGGVRRLGELLGRLHTLPEGAGGAARAGGAWHHLADGGPEDEIAAASRLLADAEGLVPVGERGAYASVRTELEGLDGCQGLPPALVHPDFVLANVIASADRGLAVVDWTGAGRGPRLWSLAFLLYAEGAKDLRRVDLVVSGYRRHVNLEPEELSRLVSALRARPLAIDVWAFCMGRTTIADVARRVAVIGELAEAVGARAQEAFTGTRS
jgi:Ser/Thr protein kinase RdoA (MazF antagonist)/predicted enzyme related to lactoylglutathione lyase